MQSKHVYCIAVFDILEEAGFEVYLVNTRETKNLPGAQRRRAGESGAEALHVWAITKFVSARAEICTMRTCWRERNDLV
jgi:hypothetical protein